MALTKMVITGRVEFGVLTDLGDNDPWEVVNMLHGEEGEHFWDAYVKDGFRSGTFDLNHDDLEITDMRPATADEETSGSLPTVRWRDWVDSAALREYDVGRKLEELSGQLDSAMRHGDYELVARLAIQLAAFCESADSGEGSGDAKELELQVAARIAQGIAGGEKAGA